MQPVGFLFFSGLETRCGAHGCLNVANHDLVATSAVMHVFLSLRTQSSPFSHITDSFACALWDELSIT
jgi:hypothetical protein